MNCPSPSRVDTRADAYGWNQSPAPLALETNQDLNGLANRRIIRDHRLRDEQLLETGPVLKENPSEVPLPREDPSNEHDEQEQIDGTPCQEAVDQGSKAFERSRHSTLRRCFAGLCKYTKFIGPGFMISVAYIDPGNYATDVAAGASYRFQLLCMVLVSNIIAIFLQTLCVRLGSVTGLNLAQNIRLHCPTWLNYVLYVFAEGAIIATDIAEVIGTAIALNLLVNVPVVAGCAISIVDVLVILLFYRPSGSMRGMRIFELFVAALVVGVVICFAVELSLTKVPDVGNLFRGYLPSSVLVKGKGLYQACGILGATVMPHSLYLGSGIVQPRLREYDEKHGNIPVRSQDQTDKYRPSLAAIRSCMTYSILELALSLFTFALFVNSAILIVSGASLSDTPGAANANLFQIHSLLSTSLAPAAGTIFALALLLSGTSAGIVCTIAGQMVSEGQLNLTMKPWLMRLMTRSFSITPSIIVAGAVGQAGLSTTLEATQVALSVILPFTSAPLIYFTCRSRIMTVADAGSAEGVRMRNNCITILFAVLLWLLIVVMNIALLVLVGLGID